MNTKTLSSRVKSLALSLVAAVCLCAVPNMNAADAESTARTESTSGIYLNNGWNFFDGVFYFNNAEYSFDIGFYYNARTGRITNATYSALDYGGKASKTKIDRLTINDGRIIAVGNNLRIDARYDSYNDCYRGSMTRGRNSGSCELYESPGC